MTAAEEALKPIPKAPKNKTFREGNAGVARNIPTIPQKTINTTTRGFVSS
jgi:hypothetical protein